VCTLHLADIYSVQYNQQMHNKFNTFLEYNQQDAPFLKFIYFCKTLYTFRTSSPSIIRSTKLHIQREAFVRPIVLPASSLTRLAAGSSNGLTNA